MSNNQKIMDKFVEQSQEILVLKDLNRRLMLEIERCKEIAERDGKDYSDVVRKLKIAIEALKEASEWHQKDDVNGEAGYIAYKAIKEIEGSIEKE